MRQHKHAVEIMMPFGRAVLAVIVSIGLLTMPTRRAHACSCGGQVTPAEAFNRSDYVFAGEVVKVSPPPQNFYFVNSAGVHLGQTYADGPVEFTFNVSEQWKGPVSPTLTVTTNPNGQCSMGFDYGGTHYVWLIYAEEYDGSLHTGMCDRTTVDRPNSDDRIFLGPGTMPPPAPPASPLQLATLPIVLAILFLVAVLISTGWVIWMRKTHRHT